MRNYSSSGIYKITNDLLREIATKISDDTREKMVAAKLETIKEILNSGDNDKDLSSKYDCSPSTIREIRTRQTYKDVM